MIFYIIFGVFVIFAWLLVDYTYRTQDPFFLRLFAILTIGSYALVAIIKAVRYLAEKRQNR